MEHPAFNDRMAQLLAASMLATSAAFVFLYPDMDKLVLASANLSLCGLVLHTGRTVQGAKARRWEQVAIATWLAASPRLLGFDHVAASLWVTVAFAVLLFLPTAWATGRQEAPRSVEARARGAQWRRPF
ncbi:hypothetical protein NE852_30250 (plasmid) [Rhizobium sp. Pop5]|uniref:hypothetical protein n=1 Tax=Rhizobium sp. Pop5 TaxID=1223565 RepID=UPI0002835F7E|nr:hypothetical protein [Rhizobium sp. Pop5]EJZ22891.1 hypothetical protein RCCGEPOP_02436 [Rhizobium sp. Pop5]UVD60079.1 hypothetical protein NE852_30250 [Rhizobium sp. Pop5]